MPKEYKPGPNFANCQGKSPAVIKAEYSLASKNGRPDPGIKSARIAVHEDWWKEQFDKMKGGMKPQIRSFICVQTDIAIPGIIFQLGLNLQLSLSTDVLCWGASIELSVGVFFGFKLGPISLGVNIHVAGTLAVAELPAEAAEASSDARQGELRGDHDADEVNHMITSNTGMCSNFKNPFRVIVEVLRKLKSGVTRDQRVKKKIAKAKEEILKSDEYLGYLDYRNFSTPGEKPGKDNYGTVAGELRDSFESYAFEWDSMQRQVGERERERERKREREREREREQQRSGRERAWTISLTLDTAYHVVADSL